MTDKTISFSEIYTFLECPQKWSFAYEERLRKNSYSNASRMNVGIVVHECLEAALKYYHETDYKAELKDVKTVMALKVVDYNSKNRPPTSVEFFDGETWDTKPNEELLVWDKDVDEAYGIAERTIEHLNVPLNWRTVSLNWDGEEVPLIEFRFEYPLVEDRTIVGKIDWIATSLKDGQTYLIDWKTRKTFSDDFEVNGEDTNLQSSIYQYVMQSLGVDIFATMTYQIRSSLPSVPEHIKPTKDYPNGRLSKAKIATTTETYKRAIIDNNEDPNDPYYAEMWDRMQGEDYWFLPITVIPSQKRLANRWTNIQQIASRMIHQTNTPKYETTRCIYCPFFKLCLASDDGLDVDTLKESMYNTDRRT